MKDIALRPKFSKKDKKDFYVPNSLIDIFAKKPAGYLRFTDYDRIRQIKKVRIFTEGKTDTQIIEHAYSVLTGQVPYWNISPVGGDNEKMAVNSGAHALSVFLSSADNLIETNDEFIIGIFDNDDKGCQEFGGLRTHQFTPWNESLRIKKHITKNIFAIKLPIPPEKEHYYQKDQRYMNFAIEHYFSDSYLKDQEILEDSPFPGVYKIRDKKKSDFAKKVVKEFDKSLFSSFTYLFKEIDSISNQMEVEYD